MESETGVFMKFTFFNVLAIAYREKHLAKFGFAEMVHCLREYYLPERIAYRGTKAIGGNETKGKDRALLPGN